MPNDLKKAERFAAMFNELDRFIVRYASFLTESEKKLLLNLAQSFNQRSLAHSLLHEIRLARELEENES